MSKLGPIITAHRTHFPIRPIFPFPRPISHTIRRKKVKTPKNVRDLRARKRNRTARKMMISQHTMMFVFGRYSATCVRMGSQHLLPFDLANASVSLAPRVLTTLGLAILLIGTAQRSPTKSQERIEESSLPFGACEHPSPVTLVS